MSTSVMEVILLNQESFQKENASGDESRTPGDGLWKGSSRPYSTPGETFRSWPRTDRSGDPFLLPHAWRHSRPMSEWVSECGKWAINEVGELNFYYKEKSVRFNISRILRVAASSPTTKQKRLRGGGGGGGLRKHVGYIKGCLNIAVYCCFLLSSSIILSYSVS